MRGRRRWGDFRASAAKLPPGTPRAPASTPLPPSRSPCSLTVTVPLASTASASASQKKRGVETASCKHPGGAPPGLGALGSDLVPIEVDVGDCTVGLQLPVPLRGKCGGRNCKLPRTLWAPPGLGAPVPDAVGKEVDVGDGAIGLQGPCECLSEDKAGSKLQAAKTPVHQRLALAPSSPILLPERAMWMTVQLVFRACASASQGSNGAGSKQPHLCHRESSCTEPNTVLDGIQRFGSPAL